MNCIGVLAHPLRPYTFPLAEHIAQTLRQHDIATWVFTDWKDDDVIEAVQGSRMVIAIGGDGAMLRAGRVCGRYGIPVLGINMGQLGFLTEINGMSGWNDALDKLLEDDFWIESRMMLRAQVIRKEEVVTTGDALNDVVVSANVFGRMIQLDCYIDQDWTTSYNADALVIATATGSTAYTLSLGGPILPPDLKNILIVPAAPHLSMDRPIVLSEGSTVEISAKTRNRGEILLSADGVILTSLQKGDVVKIQASEYVSSFVRLRGRNYFYRSLLDRLEPRSQDTNVDQHTHVNNGQLEANTLEEDNQEQDG
ncbi:MAG: NAD(+)/NADH kinase [Aggregatilineales bacterium]